MTKPDEERCPNCGATDFGVVRNMTSERQCKCGHSWPCPPKITIFVTKPQSSMETAAEKYFEEDGPGYVGMAIFEAGYRAALRCPEIAAARDMLKQHISNLMRIQSEIDVCKSRYNMNMTPSIGYLRNPTIEVVAALDALIKECE